MVAPDGEIDNFRKILMFLSDNQEWVIVDYDGEIGSKVTLEKRK